MNGRDHPDLDLCLGCGSSEPSSSGACIKEGRRLHQDLQQITIFYGGRVCVSDVTDIQAKAIICMAKGGVTMEEKQEQQLMEARSSSRSPPLSPHAVPQQLPNPELSMKRSLQRFLQKRKTRLDDSSPYAHKHSLLSLRSS